MYVCTNLQTKNFICKKISFYELTIVSLTINLLLIITRPNSVRFGMVGWVALGEPAPRLAYIGTMVKNPGFKKKVDRV
jgi:hypothetical protein